MPLVPGYHLPGTSPSELKRDPFLFRSFLQYVPDCVIEKAEQSKDAWMFLLRGRNLSTACSNFFKAAVSHSKATGKLIDIEAGLASVSRPLSVWEEALKAGRDGDMHKARIKGHKVVRGLLKNGCLVGDSMPPFKNEEQRMEITQVIGKEEETPRKKCGKDWRGNLRLEKTNADPEAAVMVHIWLSFDGKHGLCFYADEALADMMTLLCKNVPAEDNYGIGYYIECYQKKRQRMRLKQFDCHKPTVKKVRPVPGTRFIEIEYRSNDGLRKYRIECERVFLKRTAP